MEMKTEIREWIKLVGEITKTEYDLRVMRQTQRRLTENNITELARSGYLTYSVNRRVVLKELDRIKE